MFHRRLTGTLGLAVTSWLLWSGVAPASAETIGIETVTVGNPGNIGELSGTGSGAYSQGPARVCGAVSYIYNIGKYEVTAGQYAAFLNAVAGVDTYRLYNPSMANTVTGCGIIRSGGGTSADPYTYTVSPEFVNRPVNYVNWGDAARFANWLHNGQATGAQDDTTTEDGAYSLHGATLSALMAITREADWKWAITSEDEWYKAAYYNPATGTYDDYATGGTTNPGRGMDDVSGNNANYIAAGGSYPIDSGIYTTEVGQFQNSDSRYGTFDQDGNVAEWNESVVDGSNRSYRGGSYSDGFGRLLASDRSEYFFPWYESPDIGFRVSENLATPLPLPSAAWMGGTIMLALAAWPRKRRP